MPWKKIAQILNPTDIITFTYIFITGIFIIMSPLSDIQSHVLMRLGMLIIISLIICFDFFSPNTVVRFVRNFYPFVLLGYFYPETDYLNNVFFSDLDIIVAKAEVALFGGHPSIWFAEVFHWKWFNELMHFSYFTYYFLPFFLCVYIYKTSPQHFQFALFSIMLSFYLFYIIFIIIPVAGPQFYLPAPYNELPDAYFFRNIMVLVQQTAEGPTAAFPCSHVGIAFLVWWLALKFAPKLMKWFFIFGILIAFSTVYIKAHYVIDVIAGLLVVPLLYWITVHAYSFITPRDTILLHGRD
ncbi:MAG: phosphatase PAP2 family protein [Nitrospirota bacterium]